MTISRLALLFVCLSLQLTGCGDEEGKQERAATPAPAPTTPSPTPQTVSSEERSQGVGQAALAEVIEAARASFAAVEHHDKEEYRAKLQTLLAERRQAQCKLFKGASLEVVGWEGTVAGVYDSQERLCLQVAFATQAYLMTSFGIGLDKQLGITTAFAPGAPLYDTVAALEQGDRVVVSGTFVKSDVGCIFQHEYATLEDLLDQPAFLFQFSAVERR